MGKKLTFLLAIMLFAGLQYSFAQFTLSGEFTPRTEFSHGYKSLAVADQDASLFTAQRTRLNVIFKNDLISSKLVLQDVRTWGSQKQLVGNEDFGASIHEAWAEVALFKGVSLKAGRQEIIYDDHRIFGSVGWAHQARSHDLAILKYKGFVNAHVGLAYNENTTRNNNFYNGPGYKAFQYVWLNKKMKNLQVSVLFLNNGNEKQTMAADGVTLESVETIYSQTAGTHLKFKVADLSLRANFYAQMGEHLNGKTINANNFLVAANYKISDDFSAEIGMELLSGNSTLDPSADEFNAFTPFYGTNHKFNGWMDYFYVGNHVGNVGLQDIFVTGNYKMGKASFGATAHLFSTAADLADPNSTEAMDAALGTEIDLVLGYKLNDIATIKCGYSHMIATETMEVLKGGSMEEMNNWAWLMLSVKPTFFKN